MTVKSLRLRNFRNYGTQIVEFSDNLNILYGENAQGKTNILEAIFLCSTGRSHRTQKDAELIKFGEESAVVALVLERKNYGDCSIEIEIQRTGRKSILINGVPQQRAGDLLGRLNCAIFSPEDLSIIKEEPALRRRFLDMFISQIKPVYFFNLQRYLGTLRQRNALLRQARENPRLLDSIGAWDMQLAEFGAMVMKERSYFIGKISGYAKKNHAQITGGREDFSVTYDPSLKDANSGKITGGNFAGRNDGSDIQERNIGENITMLNVSENIKTQKVGDNIAMPNAGDNLSALFERTLAHGLQSDAARMATQIGPHKDDIACLIDGKNLRLYGSQGQQRTAALALKMAQVDVMAEETGDIPVLLLDDVMSELDRTRQENLSSHMKTSQTFITGAERYSPKKKSESSIIMYFNVVDGKILSEI